jgi:hypothetical protein
MRASQEDLESQIMTKVEGLTEEKLDSFNSKINELDGRIGAIEEK